jgi:hypothetical protein
MKKVEEEKGKWREEKRRCPEEVEWRRSEGAGGEVKEEEEEKWRRKGEMKEERRSGRGGGRAGRVVPIYHWLPLAHLVWWCTGGNFSFFHQNLNA